jgi:hypothetical protein
MSKFEIFIGTWNTAGKVHALDKTPATTLTATDTYLWLPGKHFIQHLVDARFGAAASRSMEVMGYDRARSKYVARSFDDQGVFDVFDIDLNRKTFTIVGSSVRFRGKFDAGGNQLAGIWEMKNRKSAWQPWIDLVLTRS